MNKTSPARSNHRLLGTILTLIFIFAHSASSVAQQSEQLSRARLNLTSSTGETSSVEFALTPRAEINGEANTVDIARALPPNSLFPEPVPIEAASPVILQSPKPMHPFWDGENRVFFATVGGLAAADFCATRANLASGGKELNPLTRIFAGSTPALATNFALETASIIAVSYMLHKTGHHKLERLTSLLSIGSSATAAGYSYAHR